MNSIDLKEQCKSFMAEYDLMSPEIIADGNVHRYSVDEKRNKLDEWYIAYEGISSKGMPYLICIFGSWSDSSKHEYKSFEGEASFTDQDLVELERLTRQQRSQAEQSIKESHDRIAQEAQELWQKYSCKPQSGAHLAYIKHKNINVFDGVKFGTSPQGYPSMIIPLYNVQDELRSLQFISMDTQGNSYKSFLLGGEKKGNFHIIGANVPDENVFFISEGYATGATIYEAIKKPVVVAFDAGNIESVVENLKQAFPKKFFIVAADNDAIGIKKANEVAIKYGCYVAIPSFPADASSDHSDFNDLANLAGIDEVCRQLMEAYVISDAGRLLAKKYFDQNEDPCKKFRLSNLPPVLREYISSIQKTTSAHPIIITASVLTMISAYLGTKVCIPEGGYFQDLYPNLWILCIAKSGQFKTTALNKGAKISYENQARVFASIKAMRENMQEEGADTEREVLIKSKENVVLPTKITAEAFLEYLSQGHQGAIYASEFGGWLQNLDKTHNNDFKAIMTELFDVPTYYRYKTKTQGDCILERPYISICGVSTLAWIKSNMKSTDVPSGFFARFIVYTPPFDGKIPQALPSPRIEEYELREDNFKKTLGDVLLSIGEKRMLALSSDAKTLFYKYHASIYCVPKGCSERVGELLQPYLKRWSPAILKVAMIIQLFIEPKSIEIETEAICTAFHILMPAIKSTIGLFEGELGESGYQRKCRTLLDWIKMRAKKDKKPIKRQAILASKQLDGGAKEYDLVLQDLIEQGKLEYKEFQKKNDSEYILLDEIEDD